MNVQVNTAAGFKATDLISALASKIGVDASKVVIEKTEFIVSVVYTLSGTVTEAQAKKALATTWGVPEHTITVVIGRRLNQLQRQLATTSLTAQLTTEAASVADDVKTKSADATQVQAEMQKSVPGVTAVVQTAAALTVNVQTAVISGKKITEPSAEDLGAIATAAGGTTASITSLHTAQSSTIHSLGASTTARAAPDADVTAGANPCAPACFIFAMAILSFTVTLCNE